MDITDAPEDRLNLGIERFLSGHSMSYHGVTVQKGTESTVHVNSYSEWEPDRTTELHAKSQIARSKVLFQDLANKSAVFLAAISHGQQEFSLCHSYGAGAIVLAKETNGQFEWLYQR